ncbi:MAG: zinc-ribbon domain-containing protein [Candidatus Acidiferrales bacterium]
MKTCQKCGLSMSDESRFCSACGADTLSGATVGTQMAPAPATVIPTETPTSGKALASMILGICSFFSVF